MRSSRLVPPALITHPGEVAEVAGKITLAVGIQRADDNRVRPSAADLHHGAEGPVLGMRRQRQLAPGRGDVLGQLPGGPQPRETIQAELGQRPGQRARITAGLYTPCTRKPGNALIPGDGATGDQASHNRLVRQRLLYGTRKPMSD